MTLALFRTATSTAVLLALSVCASETQDGAAQQSTGISLPTRRAPRPPASAEPPPLPSGSDAVTPATLHVVTSRRGADAPSQKTAQTLLRTADRVLLTIEGTRTEWLFERNPVDHRRVSGYLIDHATRRILVYQESDLRNEQHIRGWSDVLTLRLDPEVLQTLRASGRRENVGEMTFEHYVRANGTGEGISEVWWSSGALFPLRVIVRQGNLMITSEVQTIEAGVVAAKLAHPGTRFPGYVLIDLADAADHGRH